MFGLIINKVFKYIEDDDLSTVGLSNTHPFVVLLKYPNNIDNILKLDDSLFWYSIGLFQTSSDDHLKKLVDMVYRRDLFKVIDVWKIVDSITPDALHKNANDHFKCVQAICQKIREEMEEDEKFISRKCFYDFSKRTLYKDPSSLTLTQKINIKMGDRCGDISLASSIVASRAEYHVHRIYVDHSVCHNWHDIKSQVENLAKKKLAEL